jgi:hypothetical protein
MFAFGLSWWYSLHQNSVPRVSPEGGTIVQRNGYLLYDDSLEECQPNEQELISKIVDSIRRTGEAYFKIDEDKKNKMPPPHNRPHATRQQHAKNHGIVKGTLTVDPDLPAYLRQGIFSRPATYDIIVRFSTAFGDIRSDRVPLPRGMAIKILGVEGDKALANDKSGNQDLLLVNRKTYFANINDYWKVQHYFFELEPTTPDIVLKSLISIANGAKTFLDFVGVTSPIAIRAAAEPGKNILGETFHSQAALRFGDYVAKLRAVPLLDSPVGRLTGAPIGSGDNALRDHVKEFLENNAAVYELWPQLCTDP